MIKCKLITNCLALHHDEEDVFIDADHIDEHDDEVATEIDKINEEGNSIISMNTKFFGKYMNWARTEIIYRENQTRKVLVEKS